MNYAMAELQRSELKEVTKKSRLTSLCLDSCGAFVTAAALLDLDSESNIPSCSVFSEVTIEAKAGAFVEKVALRFTHATAEAEKKLHAKTFFLRPL